MDPADNWEGEPLATFESSDTITFGRDDSNDVSLADAWVSPRHARIDKKDVYILVDLDSNDGGRLEIVAASMDRHVYAWNDDGSPVPGYIAPDTTVPPASRVGLLLICILRDAHPRRNRT